VTGPGIFISHPEVVIDPAVPVPRWVLTDGGIARMRRLAAKLDGVSAIWASDEAKAIEAAGILAGRFGLPVKVHPGLGEMDRSSTGYRPKAAFERLADAFFAEPEASIEGWERAIDAQRRILAAAEAIVAQHQGGMLALVGHGGTGTLLRCAWAGLPIDRRHDQPGAGCTWRFSTDPVVVTGGWEAIA